MTTIKAYQLKEGDVTKWGTVFGVEPDIHNIMVIFENGRTEIFPNEKMITIGKATK